MLHRRINLKHLSKNSYEIRFFLEIANDVFAKRPVGWRKRFAAGLQKAQNRTGLSLGQHPNRGEHVELHPRIDDELKGFRRFRSVHCLIVSDFHSYTSCVNAQKRLPRGKSVIFGASRTQN
jgi:hypothetical protein